MHWTHALSIAPLFALVTTSSLAATRPSSDFSCRNEHLEISCDEKKCEARSEGFTPMEASRSGNTLSVCAYSACRSGKIDLIRTRGNHVFLHAAIPEPIGSVAVVQDTSQNRVTTFLAGLVIPMECAKT